MFLFITMFIRGFEVTEKSRNVRQPSAYSVGLLFVIINHITEKSLIGL